MASSSLYLLLAFILLCACSSSCSSSPLVNGIIHKYGRVTRVGGRMDIDDVKNNKEVQELGRFCVKEHNRREELHGDGVGALIFLEVVEGQKQVVNGIKYFLKVDAEQDGVARTFDAIVVVKAWVPSKKLLEFTAPRTN